MGLKTKKILGIDVTISPKVEILEEIRKYLQKFKNQKSKIKSEEIKPLVIFTPNPEIITYAQKDKNFGQIVNTAQINLPDGAGVVWAIKKLYGVDVERVQGVDFMLELVKMAEEESFRIGLIGGRGGLAVSTLECLRQNHPKLSGWAMEGHEIEIKNEKLKIKNYESKQAIKTELEDGYFLSLVNEIRERKIAILFVALGFPKQEYFISQWSVVSLPAGKAGCQLSARPLVLMAVGGAFDYISGRVPRAPLILRNMGLEWLFRLIREPWRLPRQLKGAEFFFKILFR